MLLYWLDTSEVVFIRSYAQLSQFEGSGEKQLREELRSEIVYFSIRLQLT